MTGSILMPIFIAVVYCAIYQVRIKAEEEMLIKNLGKDYVAFKKRVPSRLIPFVF